MQPKQWPFLAILIAYLLTAGQFALRTPAWQSPDEPAHYNYVKQLAAGAFPIMENRDYNQSYQAEAISARFAPPYTIEPFTYEDYQPPLYYLLQTPVFLLSGGSLSALRLFGVFLGALTLTLAYGTFVRLERLFRPRAVQSTYLPYPLALTATAFFAFLPQHIAIQAGLNNDSLSELLIVAVLLLISDRLAAGNAPPNRMLAILKHEEFALATLLGFALLTKVTAYLLAPVIAVYLLWRHWGDWAALWRSGLRIFLPALALGLIWWGRNLALYGWPDFLGIEAHDRAVVGQPTTAEWLALYGPRYLLTQFGSTTFRSFWGQFGWMGVLMDGRIYQLLALFSGLIAAGWVIAWPAGRRTARAAVDRKPAWAATSVLTTLLLLNIALYLAYNITYVQHQGRYLFASLLPLSWAAASGLHGWLTLSGSRFPWLRALLPFGLTVALVALDWLALYRFILPQLTLP